MILKQGPYIKHLDISAPFNFTLNQLELDQYQKSVTQRRKERKQKNKMRETRSR